MSQPPTDAAREVTQEDREAAAANIKRRLVWQHGGEQPWIDASTASMRMGEQDDHDEVQAFARHRLAERERCAKVAENFDPRGIMTTPAYDQCAAHGDDIATAIREANDVG